MHYRRLGRTELKVSEVGLGGGGLGGVWSAVAPRDATRVVDRAIDLGVNLLDVAPVYGDGRAERAVGRALSGRRSRVVLSTKVDLRPSASTSVRRQVRDSLRGSLRRLRTDYVDVLFVHNPLTTVRGGVSRLAILPHEALAMAEAMEEVRAEGRVRYLGFTALHSSRAATSQMIGSGLFDVAQAEYNVLNRSALHCDGPRVRFVDPDELPLGPDAISGTELVYELVDEHGSIDDCYGQDIGVMAVRALFAGVLSDAGPRPDWAGDGIGEVNRRVGALRTSLPEGWTLPRLAIRFCLQARQIGSVIVGATNAREIEDAVAWSQEGPLPSELAACVDALYRSGFAAGR